MNHLVRVFLGRNKKDLGSFYLKEMKEVLVLERMISIVVPKT
jgi:hypothetical protein